VRRVYDAVARRDVTTLLALYDSEVEWDVSRHPLRDLLGRTVYRGHEGMDNFSREWDDAWEKVEYGYQELMDEGEHVITVETMRGRGRASGTEVDMTHYVLFTIRDGKIVRQAFFDSLDEAREAAGLRE
jgi:ketosteroid isomerase-like protein